MFAQSGRRGHDVRVLGLATMVLLGLAGEAGAVPIGQQIVNGEFGTGPAPSLAGWIVVGTADARDNFTVINLLGGNTGFDRFFGLPPLEFPPTNAFAVLGNRPLCASSIDAPQQGICSPLAGLSSISQSFVLPAVVGGSPVSSYQLTVSFRSVFDGRDALTFHDVFSVVLDGTVLLSRDSSPLPECGPDGGCANQQLEQNPFLTAATVLPGAHTLSFRLEESGLDVSPADFTDTAVGIDVVSVLADATLETPVPEPPSGLLLVAALAGLALTRRARPAWPRSRPLRTAASLRRHPGWLPGDPH